MSGALAGKRPTLKIFCLFMHYGIIMLLHIVVF